MYMMNIHTGPLQIIFEATTYDFATGEVKIVPDSMRGYYEDTLQEVIPAPKVEVKEVNTQDVVIKTPTNKGKVQCEALTKKGTRCKQKALKGKTFCPTHSKKNK